MCFFGNKLENIDYVIWDENCWVFFIRNIFLILFLKCLVIKRDWVVFLSFYINLLIIWVFKVGKEICELFVFEDFKYLWCLLVCEISS